jgi:hypothetical protein
MSATPLWVPLAAAGLAVLGTLGGVVVTQAWNSRAEERRQAREDARLREERAREDLNRSYEHRRAAYLDFLREFDRLYERYLAPRHGKPGRPPSFDDPAWDGLDDRHSALLIYGTYEAERAAFRCLQSLRSAASRPEDKRLDEDLFEAWVAYLGLVRKDLGMPEWKPAREPGA